MLGQSNLPEKRTETWNACYTLALNCVGHSLSVLENDASSDQYRVRPQNFIRWAESKQIAIPNTLLLRVNESSPLSEPTKKPRKLRLEQEHRQRCRGVAALLWDALPSIKITRMAEKEELYKFGCEGTAYKKETIQNWIKDLCPNRSPGRRKQG